MKIGLYENYKFTNLYGGRSSSTPPGRTETNKLKGLVKQRTGGVQPPQPPPPPAICTTWRINIISTFMLTLTIKYYLECKEHAFLLTDE